MSPPCNQELARSGDGLDPIYCLSGCTAVGKTELALGWAEANGAEIVNCDSLLFYRGMDVGTAKPTAEELGRARHHLVDVLEPWEPMDVGRYVGLAEAAIREIQGRGRLALVTGGSGFYLKAFFEPVVDAVTVSDATRRRAAGLMEDGLAAAVAALRELNPEGLGGLDELNPRRVVKALERCLETGSSLGELRAAFAEQGNALTRAEKRLTILEREKDELNGRIEARVDAMLAGGLVEETRRLVAAGFERNPSAAGAIGYRETLAYLRGELDGAGLREAIVVNTRRLAKKQRTWFRGQLPDWARRLDLSGGRAVGAGELFG